MPLTKKHCCKAGKAAVAGNTVACGHRKYFWSFAEWLIPGMILALIPKCPLCIMAYVAVATGFGLSFSMASTLRTVLIIACVLTILYLLAKKAARTLNWFPPHRRSH